MSKKSSKFSFRNTQYSLFDPIEVQIPPRVLLVRFFYWPFLSVELDDAFPLAVIEEKGIVECVSPRAKDVGIRRGDEIKSTLSMISGLLVFPLSSIDQGKMISKVNSVLEQFSPLVEMVDQGMWAIDVKGPSRYFGGEESLVAQLRNAISVAIQHGFASSKVPYSKRGKSDCSSESLFSFGVSIADGIFAARIAARGSLIVAAGGSGEFLAPLSIEELPDQEIARILMRLGIESLGEFAALDYHLVLERFGVNGALSHHLASGLDTSALIPSQIKEDFSEKIELQESLDVASAVVFACKSRVEEILRKLLAKGYVCQTMRVSLMSEDGEESIRDWSIEGGFSAHLLLERIRWQLESWSSDPRFAPSSGVVTIQLVPQRVVSSSRNQLALDGSERTTLVKITQSLSRVDSIVGKKSSFAKIKGSRTAKGSVDIIPWQLYLFDKDHSESGNGVENPPWPGKPLGMSPAICFEPEIEVNVTGTSGLEVVVCADVSLSDDPYWICLTQPNRRFRIHEWSTLWPMSDRWWDQAQSTRVVRMQIRTYEMGALLIKRQGGKWFIEGGYD